MNGLNGSADRGSHVAGIMSVKMADSPTIRFSGVLYNEENDLLFFKYAADAGSEPLTIIDFRDSDQ